MIAAVIGNGRNARRYERRRLRGRHHSSRGGIEIEEKYRRTNSTHGESTVRTCHEAGRFGTGDEWQDHYRRQH